MATQSRLFCCLAVSTLLAAGACQDKVPEGDAIVVPSGREVQALDVITNAPGPAGATARFRFVVPGLNAAEDTSADMQAICDDYSLPRIEGMVPAPQQIVIVFADRAVPFGEAAPEAVQFFEAFSVQDGACIWEVF
jgi:hypothetical protein